MRLMTRAPRSSERFALPELRLNARFDRSLSTDAQALNAGV